MKKEEELQRRDSSHTIESLEYFIEALYRMFKIGIYYPVGHVILDQSASKCLQQLREISATSINISVNSKSISIQNLEIPKKNIAAEELRNLLYQLSLQSIELLRTISHKELLSFVKNLLSWRSQLEANRETRFDSGILPPTINLVQQEYPVEAMAADQGVVAQRLDQNLEQLCSALQEQGLGKTEVNQCRDLLEKISLKNTGKQIDIAGFPYATWSDVKGLLCKIVTTSYEVDEKKFSSLVQTDINAISSILQSLRNGLTDKKSKYTVQRIISHLTARNVDEKAEIEAEQIVSRHKQRKAKKRKPETIHNISIKMLETYIHNNSVSLEVLEKISVTDHSERLSILLQLLKDQPPGRFQKKIESGLRSLLAKSLSSREKSVVVGGVKSLAYSADTKTFSRVLPLVLKTLRRADGYNSLDFVVDLWGGMPHAMHLLLWPFLINELLMVGMSGSKQSFYDATEIASHIHREAMYQLQSHIEKMDAFIQKEIAEVVFRPTFIYSYQLFAFLLQTSLRDILVVRIHRALIEEPQDRFIEVVAPLLDMTVQSHELLLRTYMEQVHLESQPLALRREAGRIILDFLHNISENQKALPWLAKTIAATENLNVEGMGQILQEIVEDKKMGVLHSWPKECRNAAEKVLRRTSGKLL